MYLKILIFIGTIFFQQHVWSAVQPAVSARAELEGSGAFTRDFNYGSGDFCRDVFCGCCTTVHHFTHPGMDEDKNVSRTEKINCVASSLITASFTPCFVGSFFLPFTPAVPAIFTSLGLCGGVMCTYANTDVFCRRHFKYREQEAFKAKRISQYQEIRALVNMGFTWNEIVEALVGLKFWERRQVMAQLEYKIQRPIVPIVSIVASESDPNKTRMQYAATGVKLEIDATEDGVPFVGCKLRTGEDYEAIQALPSAYKIPQEDLFLLNAAMGNIHNLPQDRLGEMANLPGGAVVTNIRVLDVDVPEPEAGAAPEAPAEAPAEAIHEPVAAGT